MQSFLEALFCFSGSGLLQPLNVRSAQHKTTLSPGYKTLPEFILVALGGLVNIQDMHWYLCLKQSGAAERSGERLVPEGPPNLGTSLWVCVLG